MAGWNVTEDPDFEISVIGCGGYQIVDEALAPIELALRRNPLGFPVIPGYPNIRIAKTSIIIRGGFIIPALKLRIWVDEVKHEVAKLHVEIAPPDDMKLWDDDEIPF